MTQGYYTGLSGIMSHQYGLDIVSDNIANVNTVGFRGVTSEFAELFSNVVSSAGNTPTSNDIGTGSRLQATGMITQSGSLLPTDRFSDLAIGGNGWFGVMANNNTYYTRAGNFTFDTALKNPNDPNSSVARLTTTQGYYVTGTMLTNYDYVEGFIAEITMRGLPHPRACRRSRVNASGRRGYRTPPNSPILSSPPHAEFKEPGRENAIRSISSDVISPNNEINRLKLTRAARRNRRGGNIIVPDGLWTWCDRHFKRQRHRLRYQTGQPSRRVGGLASFTIPSVNNDGATVAIDVGTVSKARVDQRRVLVAAHGRYIRRSPHQIRRQHQRHRQRRIFQRPPNCAGTGSVYHFKTTRLERARDTLFTKSSNSGDPFFWTDADGNAILGDDLQQYAENSNVRLTVWTDMIIMQRALSQCQNDHHRR